MLEDVVERFFIELTLYYNIENDDKKLERQNMEDKKAMCYCHTRKTKIKFKKVKVRRNKYEIIVYNYK